MLLELAGCIAPNDASCASQQRCPSNRDRDASSNYMFYSDLDWVLCELSLVNCGLFERNRDYLAVRSHSNLK